MAQSEHHEALNQCPLLGGCEDDGPPIWQERQCLLDGEVGAAEVGIENIIENVLGHFCDGAQFGYARIHVEDINLSVLLTDLLDQRVKLGRLRDIGSPTQSECRSQPYLSA